MARNIQMLYAEDGEVTADLIQGFLERHGFTVRIAHDGDEALKMYNKLAPDILLFDIVMPGKDGIELLKRIRECNRQIPIVLYGSHINYDQELDAISSGADLCIHKDCPLKLLLAKLNNIYERLAVEKEMKIYHISPFSKFNASSMLLYVNNVCVELPSVETYLLHLLCVKLHETTSFEFLKKGIWGKNTDNKDSALRKYITSLRKFLEADPLIVLHNDYGRGYRLTLKEYENTLE